MRTANRTLISTLEPADAIACEADVAELMCPFNRASIPDALHELVELELARAWLRGHTYAMRDATQMLRDAAARA